MLRTSGGDLRWVREYHSNIEEDDNGDLWESLKGVPVLQPQLILRWCVVS
jgi:hypothetical protein